MRLVLIYPDILKGSNWSGYYYTGVGYISAVARQAGHKVSFLHITHPLCKGEFLSLYAQAVGGEGRVLAGFSATTNMFQYVKQWASWIKSVRGDPVIVGGVHPTLNAEETLGAEDIDAVCIGEGEGPIVELLDAMERGEDVSGVRNVWIKQNGVTHRNGLRPVIENLDALPFPDRGIFDYANLDCEQRGIAVFMASRGCPYDCSYCCNHALKKVVRQGGAKTYVRFRSPENVIQEIKETVAAYGFIKSIHFDDDILPIRKKWFRAFSDLYAREVGLPFECNIRPNLIDEEIIGLLKDAGCTSLRIGVESGDSYIRNEILNRSLSEETMLRAAELCRTAGMKLYTFNMVGLPREDARARLDTLKFNARMQSDEQQVSIFFPYEGTALYDLCVSDGLMRERDVTDPFRDTSLSLPPIERNRVLFTAYFFTPLVLLYKKIFRLPPARSARLESLCDRVLSSRLFATLVCPPLVGFVRLISKQKKLEMLARKVKRALASPQPKNAGDRCNR
ncbi:MAG: radical SAM protein [Syntrophobacteraceae bacterium]